MRNSDSDTAPPGFERSLAVVIGINSYSHGIPPLLNAVRDATAVADSLERQGFEVLRLLDAEATLSSLSHLLSHHLPSLESPPDRLLIYFAGHGLAHTDNEHQLSGFLLPSDARRDDTSSYWPMAALREALSHLPCRHLLLILDCCFAGAFPHSPSRDIRPPSVPAPLYLERFRHFSSRRSFQLLLSTAHDELASDRLLAKPSQESLGDGLHSPFALALLQGLQPLSPADSNQDGLLTAAELYTFLRDRLLSLVPSHCQQTPSLWHLDWHDGGEFLFLLSDSFPSLPPAAPLSQRSNPYLGLRPFSSAQRHLFFGRERLVDSLLERLRTQPLLLLCGPSGAGKSSLVHAGLLPRMSEDPSWRVPPSLRPSSQPFHALSSWLASLGPETAAPSAADLASRPRSAAEFLGSFLVRHPERSVLLVIDPLEEIVTSCLNDSLRRAFLRALSGLLQLSHPRLHLLLLLRSDFEPHFLALLQPCAIPSSLWHGGRLNLQPMNRDELRRCIEKPAEACVLFFSPGLIERLLDDVEQMPGALPLLSVALSELFGAYLGSGRNDRTLCFEDYRHIGGGIAGALQRRAELVFSGTPPPLSEGQPALPPVPASELPAFQRTLRNVLLRMVAPEGGELARRRVPRSELEYPHREENARVQRVLRTLEASRLVVASDDGGPCIEPAHDALLSAWPRLHDWARHAQRELLLLRRVSHAASEWHRHRHTADFLWADARLDQLDLAPASLRHTDVPLALPTTSPGSQPTEPLALNATESGFLRTSATRRRFLRTRRNTLTLTVAVMLVALTVAALFQADKATGSAREAQIQQEAAEANAHEARRQEHAAKTNAREAQKQEQLAKANAREAQQQQAAAEANLREARKQQVAADSNAREAQWQQAAAEANALEARKQQQIADTNAKEALAQKNTAETNAWEAQKQQQIADANARETLIQKNASESNAQEARKQQEAAESSTREAQRQKDLALASARLTQVERLIKEDPTKALLVLLEVSSQSESPGSSWLHSALELSQRAISSTIIAGQGDTLSTVQHGPAGSRIDVINAVQFSPDSSRVLIAAGDGTTRIWRADGSGTPIVITGPTDWLASATFSPDGSRVLITSNYGTARIWHTDGSGTPIVLTNDTGEVRSATFSPDGSCVLIASNDTVRIWHAAGYGNPIVITSHTNDLVSANFSPDSSSVLTTSNDGTVRIWRADGSGTPIVLTGHTNEVTSASFSPDGSRVVTASNDGTVRIWRADGYGIPTFLTGSMEWGRSVSFSPDDSLVLTASDDGTVRIWRTDGSGTPIVLTGHMDEVTTSSFNPDGALALTASKDGTARIWRTDGSRTSIVLTGHTDEVTSASFSSDSALVLTVSGDGTARIWRTDGTGTPIVLTSHTEKVISASFSPDSSRVLTVSDDGTTLIWRTDGTGTPIVLTSHSLTEVISASFSPDSSRVLTVSSDGTTLIWRAEGSDTPIVLTGPIEELTSTNSDPFGCFIAGPTNGVEPASFSPDGSHVLTVTDSGVRILRADGSGTPIVLTGPIEIISTKFSPDGSHVLTASADGMVRIWRVDEQTPPLLLRQEELSEEPVHASFLPNGSRVFTVSIHGVLRIWPITPVFLRNTLRNATTICLSVNERERYLLESLDEARESHERCERSHGRLP